MSKWLGLFAIGALWGTQEIALWHIVIGSFTTAVAWSILYDKE